MRLLDPVGKIVKGPGLLPVKTRRAESAAPIRPARLGASAATRAGLPCGDSSRPMRHSARWCSGSGWHPRSLPSAFEPATIPAARSSPEVSHRSGGEFHPAPPRPAHSPNAYFQKLYSASGKVKAEDSGFGTRDWGLGTRGSGLGTDRSGAFVLLDCVRARYACSTGLPPRLNGRSQGTG